MAVFVASSAPAGWPLGKWAQTGDLWEEVKVDGSDISYQFEVVTGPSLPASKTVRLRMKSADAGVNTEVMLTDTTAQIFVDGQYLGEYAGEWQQGGQAAARTPVTTAQTTQGASAPPPAQASTARPAPVAAAPAAAAPPQARPAKASNLDASPESARQLIDAIKKGDTAAVERLLAANVDPDCTGSDGTTPLLAAAEKGHLAVVQALLAAGADANVGKDGSNPMTVAFQKGHQEVLKALFTAAFQNLESAVASHAAPLAPSATARAAAHDDHEVPEAALFELREVTAKLASLSTQKAAGHAPTQHYEAPGSPAGDMDKMREEAVKDAMKLISRVNK